MEGSEKVFSGFKKGEILGASNMFLCGDQTLNTSVDTNTAFHDTINFSLSTVQDNQPRKHVDLLFRAFTLPRHFMQQTTLAACCTPAQQ